MSPESSQDLLNLQIDYHEAIARTEILTLLAFAMSGSIAESVDFDLYVNLCALDQELFGEPGPDSHPQDHIDRRRLHNQGYSIDDLEEESPRSRYPEFVPAFQMLSRYRRDIRRPRFDLERQALYQGIVVLVAQTEALLDDLAQLADTTVKGNWIRGMKALRYSRSKGDKGTTVKGVDKSPLWIRLEGLLRSANGKLGDSIYLFTEDDYNELYRLIETRHCLAHGNGTATDNYKKRIGVKHFDSEGGVVVTRLEFSAHCARLRRIGEFMPIALSALSSQVDR